MAYSETSEDWKPKLKEVVWIKSSPLPFWPCTIMEYDEDSGKVEFEYFGDQCVGNMTFNPKKKLIKAFYLDGADSAGYAELLAKGEKYQKKHPNENFADAVAQAEKKAGKSPFAESDAPAHEPARASARAPAHVPGDVVWGKYGKDWWPAKVVEPTERMANGKMMILYYDEPDAMACAPAKIRAWTAYPVEHARRDFKGGDELEIAWSKSVVAAKNDYRRANAAAGDDRPEPAHEASEKKAGKRKRGAGEPLQPAKSAKVKASAAKNALGRGGSAAADAGDAAAITGNSVDHTDEAMDADSEDDDFGEDGGSDDDDDEGASDQVLGRQASLSRDAEDMRDPRNYKEGDVVWIKLPRFQYWPSIVVRTSGKAGASGKGKLYFTHINWGEPDVEYKIDLPKVGKNRTKDKDPPVDVARFKGATMASYLKKAVTCRTLVQQDGDRDVEMLERAFELAKRRIQKKANAQPEAEEDPPGRYLPGHSSVTSIKEQTTIMATKKVIHTVTETRTVKKVVKEQFYQAQPKAASRESSTSSYTSFSDSDTESDEPEISEEDQEILRLRKPFEDFDPCLAAVKAEEQRFRDIAAGKTRSKRFDQFRREGSDFRNPIAVGPFQNEDDQIEPITDLLKEWFPGRDNQTLREEVLLEEALLLIVQKITNVDRTAAEALMQRPKWITSAERQKYARVPEKRAVSGSTDDDTGNESSDVE